MGEWKLVLFVILATAFLAMLFNVHPILAEATIQTDEVSTILYPILGVFQTFSNYLTLLTFSIIGMGTFGVLYVSCKKKNNKNIKSVSNK